MELVGEGPGILEAGDDGTKGSATEMDGEGDQHVLGAPVFKAVGYE